MVTVPDACEILEMLSEASIKVFLDGGWGVDALIGRETRIHNDIDLFVEKKDYGKAISVSINPQAQVLFHLGYECDEKMSTTFCCYAESSILRYLKNIRRIYDSIYYDY